MPRAMHSNSVGFQPKRDRDSNVNLKHITRVAALAAALVISALPARAQTGQASGPVPIKAVEITGLRRVKEDVARQLIGIKGGDSITLGHIDDAIHRLWATGQFKDVSVVTAPQDGGSTSDPVT